MSIKNLISFCFSLSFLWGWAEVSFCNSSLIKWCWHCETYEWPWPMNNLLLVPAFFLLGMGSHCHAVTHWVPKEGTPITHQCKADTHITFRQVVRRLWWPDKWGYEHCWICLWDFTIPCSVMRGRAIRHEWQQLSLGTLLPSSPAEAPQPSAEGWQWAAEQGVTP